MTIVSSENHGEFINETKLNEEQKKDLNKLNKYKAIFVHYSDWDEKWDEWIFIKDDNIFCECNNNCIVDKKLHRLSIPYTQSIYQKKDDKPGWIFCEENNYCFCNESCKDSNHRLCIRAEKQSKFAETKN